MNAQTVWNVWRRIMREPALQQRLIHHPDSAGDLVEFGFTPEEEDAALAYLKSADQAKWFITNYRFRLVNSVLNALATGAPLVLRALLANGIDLKALGHEFLDEKNWRDYGPYVYGHCFDALTFLESHPLTDSPLGLRSLIGLEKSVIQLLLDLGTSGSNAPQGLATPANQLEHLPFAKYYRSQMRLSTWMRDKHTLGRVNLEHGVEHYLVYLPDAESNVKFALLPPRAAEIYQVLVTPCTQSTLAEQMVKGGHIATTDRDQQYLRVLGGYRAITATSLHAEPA